MAQAQTDDAAALARYKKAEAIAKAHIKTFDTLDFDVFSNQKWDRLKESRANRASCPEALSSSDWWPSWRTTGYQPPRIRLSKRHCESQ